MKSDILQKNTGLFTKQYNNQGSNKMKTPTKTLTITGNLAGDLDRLCEAYANRGWYYGAHIAHALENAAKSWRDTLAVALDDRANDLHFWENSGQYITQFGHTEPNDYKRNTANL